MGKNNQNAEQASTDPVVAPVVVPDASTFGVSPDVWVRYVGPSQHTRVLTGSDVLHAGVPDGVLNETLIWGPSNGHRVFLKDIHPMLRNYFENSSTFAVENTDH